MDNSSPTQPHDDFELLEQGADNARVRLRFSGPFAGEVIVWDATFRTRGTQDDCNAIEIGDEGAAGRQLTVILGVPGFDLPAIRKTIIMVRQYKRLRPGRIAFG